MGDHPIKDAARYPQKALGDALMKNRNAGKNLPRFTVTECVCARCQKHRRLAEGVGLLDLKADSILTPLRIFLNELPVASTAHRGWSHCGVINQQMSDLAQVPIHIFQSACPDCHGRDTLEEVENLKRALAAQPSAENGTAPRVCRECGVSNRDGLNFDLMAKFAEGDCMASVTLLEVDPRGWDFHPKLFQQAEHWAFHGVLDLTKGPRASAYRWSITCPRCIAAQLPVASRALVVAPNRPVLQ
jgi:hypothetical protein